MKHRCSALLLAWVLALGCTPSVGPAEGPDPKGKGGASGSTPTNPGDPGGMGGSGPGPVGAPPTSGAVPECKGDELPGPRRLRLLTRAEYASTVADLLFITAPSWTTCRSSRWWMASTTPPSPW
jgi:hypothetical protein